MSKKNLLKLLIKCITTLGKYPKTETSVLNELEFFQLSDYFYSLVYSANIYWMPSESQVPRKEH